MQSLDLIEAQYKTTIENDDNISRYEDFGKLSTMVDDFAMMMIYRNPRAECQTKRHDYAMLGHNAVNGYVTARNFSKYLNSGRYATHYKTGIPYTSEETKEVIDRNDAVAVQNYKDIINLFKELLEISSQKGPK